MTLNDRLVAARKAATLSIQDMATWFECNRQTMNAWLSGVEPMPPKRQQIADYLGLLDKAIKEGTHFPIALSVTQFERKAHIEGIRDGVIDRISKPCTAVGRREVLDSPAKEG